MSRLMTRTAVTLGASTAAVAMGVFGSAVAHASPNVVGMTYGEASSELSTAGFTPVVSTTVGAALPWPDCVVTHQRDRTAPAPPNSQWNGGADVEQTLVTLNCNASLASPGYPGNSLASPEGRSAAASEEPATPATPEG
jgi:hypothetical protein